MLKGRWFRILAIIGLVLGLYAIAGFLVAPKLVRNALIDGIHDKLGLTAKVGKIAINPFLFHIDIDDFSILDESSQKLIGFDRLFVAFELSSIWHRAYTFREIQIVAPFAYAVIAADGRLNLRSLQPKVSPTPVPAPPERPLPAIQIGDFAVTQGLFTYADNSRPSAFSARLDPVNFELRNFTTGVQGGRFTFSGSSNAGERLEWQGHLSLQPLASDGDFRISSLRARTLYDYLKQQLAFVISSGSIDLNGRYRFALHNDVDLHVDLAQLAIADLGIRPSPDAPDWIAIPRMVMNSTAVDLGRREVHIDSLAISGAKFDTWLDADGKFNLLQLAGPRAAAGTGAAAGAGAGAGTGAAVGSGAAGGSARVAGAAAANAPVGADTATHGSVAQPWQVALAEFDIDDAKISTEDRSIKPPAKIVLSPFSLKVKGASQDLSKPVELSLAMKINGAGSADIGGQLTPDPLLGEFQVKLAGIELKDAQPYITQHSGINLLDGRLSADGRIHYQQAPSESNKHPQKSKLDAPPQLSFEGEISVERLHTIDKVLRKDLVNWERLQIAGLKFQRGPDRLQIEKITAVKPYARVIIATDRSLNVTDALADPSAPPVRVAASAAAAATAAGSTARAKSVQVAAASKGTPAAVQTGARASVMPIEIKQVLIKKGEADFADFSIKPNFAAGIQALDGSIKGLSSAQNSRAKVDIRGEVDRFSPVSIEGEVNLFSAALYTDLALSFRNIELTTFNPYSGKFAGYNISKGKLTTELKYKIEGRKLDAGHHIEIDQLEFGDKTNSKDAVSLPVKLAVALLKDRHGVIDLDVPVTGSLDDPQFRLGPIIWKVIINLLVKIVTSPFALLGSMFGGGPDLQFIDFRAGSAQLDPAGRQKIDGVAKALEERPQLKIELPIAAAAEIDRPALIEARFEDLIRGPRPASGGADHSTGEGAAPPFDQLAPKTQLEILTRVYKAQLGSSPKFPEEPASSITAPETAAAAGSPVPPTTRAEAKAEALTAKIQFLRDALHQHIVVDDSQLQALGQHRAEALQRELLTNTQIDPARVFLVANGKAQPAPPLVRLELSLQ